MVLESNFVSEDSDIDELINRFGGSSFNLGAYRVLKGHQIRKWNGTTADAFPQFRERVTCFGYDWLGRFFALDSHRHERDRRAVIMLEPGTGEALEIPANLQSFHDEELINYADAALAIEFHGQWLASGGQAPGLGQCVGYKVPLFLGGKDDISNVELTDLDVYWTICGQLLRKVRSLPAGTRVARITMDTPKR